MKREPTALTHAVLREAAYGYLGRSAASAAQVKSQLNRKITAWGRASERAGIEADRIHQEIEAARDLVEPIVAEMIASRLVDDARFADARARRLAGAGKSRRVILMHLASKGVDSQVAHEAVPQDLSAEMDAAVRFARKRRIGPFARDAEDAQPTREMRQKQIGAMARAGFDVSTCERVLRLTREEAEERLGARGGW